MRIGYDLEMGHAIKTLIVWLVVEVGLPALFFAIIYGADAALACLAVMSVVYVLSVPFIIIARPMWVRAEKLLDSEAEENSQD